MNEQALPLKTGEGGPQPVFEPVAEVTLAEVAAAAGVSRSTVSRALRNHPRIGKVTTRQIKQLAAQMGYRRDPSLTELMVHLRHRKKNADRPVLAFLLWQNIPLERQVFESADTILGGLWSRAVECGYQPELFNLVEFDNNRKRLSQILRSRGIRGGILCSVERPAPLPAVPWDELSIVATGYSIFSHHLHRCASNHYQGMLDCIENLRRLGYRRIGAVLAPSVHDRTHGYYHAAYLMSEATTEHDRLAPLLICPPGGEAIFNSWLDTWNPQVIICGGIAHLVQPWLEKRGLKVPQDVGLADLQIRAPGAASGIWQNSFEIGVAAIDLLSTLLENNESGLPAIPRIVSVNGQWMEGGSTRRIPRA